MTKHRSFQFITALFIATAFCTISYWNEGHAVVVDEAVISKTVIQHVTDMAKNSGRISHGERLNIEIMGIPRAPFDFRETPKLSNITLNTTSSLDRFFSNRALVQVKITSNISGRTRQVGVPVKVSLSKKVWVAKTMIMPGESLSPRNLELENREITTNFDYVAGAEIDLSQYSTRMMLKKGQMVTTHQMVRPPAVQRNNMVKIIMAGANGLKIILDGKSMEDGHIGQRVRVRNRYSKDKFYTGKVISENRVQVGM